MKINDLINQLNKISDLKLNNNFDNCDLSELQSLPSFNGLCELKFNTIPFYMINIGNDDAVVLKFLWRNKYENLSLKIWYLMTRKDGYFFDIGAHTGIYSIIGNLNKNQNNIISIEAYFLNYSRLLSNLKINKISSKNCFLAAASDSEGYDKLMIKTNPHYHSSGGVVSKNGQFTVTKNKIDNFKLNKKISGIKIDTEGHELEVLKGAENSLNINKPDIIFEINENCFNKCLDFLKPKNYKFFFIDEQNKKLKKIEKFIPALKNTEGSNCFATINNINEVEKDLLD